MNKQETEITIKNTFIYFSIWPSSNVGHNGQNVGKRVKNIFAQILRLTIDDIKYTF